MSFLLDEDEYEAALIDEFDAVAPHPLGPPPPPPRPAYPSFPAHSYAAYPSFASQEPAKLPVPSPTAPIHAPYQAPIYAPPPPPPPPLAGARMGTSDSLLYPKFAQHDFEVKQREIERELEGYQHQLDYLAQALAGNTPHQVEERRKRDEERRERERQRLVATETRVQHQIERAHEREQRRAKVIARAHRASRSPSPDGRATSGRRGGEPHEEEEEENV